MKRCHPLPEAIDGKPWAVKGSRGQASVDLKSRVILVPIDENPQSLFLRAHEQGHCAITPVVAPDSVAAKAGVTFEALQVCEDARVHWFLSRAGVDRSPGGLTPAEVAGMAPRLATSPRSLGAALVGTYDTGDYGKVLDSVRAVIDKAAESEVPAPGIIDATALHGIIAAARNVVNRVRQVGKGKNHPAHSKRGFARNTIPAAQLFDLYFAPEGMYGDDAGDGQRDPMWRERMLEYKDTVGEWGEMSPPQRLPMSRCRRLDRRGGRGSTFRDEGAMPNALHRWASDGRIFKRHRPAPGGTVLVDVSGSMSLSGEDVENIVAAAPAATVAIYAGRRTTGGLRIVAAGGRVASETEISRAVRSLGGGNIVDGPALKWLVEQSAPRIWVCDGWVTGKNEQTSKNLVSEAYGLVRRGNVLRVDRAQDVAAMIAAMSRKR